MQPYVIRQNHTALLPPNSMSPLRCNEKDAEQAAGKVADEEKEEEVGEAIGVRGVLGKNGRPTCQMPSLQPGFLFPFRVACPMFLPFFPLPTTCLFSSFPSPPYPTLAPISRIDCKYVQYRFVFCYDLLL